MRLGITSYAYAWHVGVSGSLPERPWDCFDLVREAGGMALEVLQLCENTDLAQLSPAERSRLLRLADQLEISLEVGTRGISAGQIEHVAGIALQFGSRLVRLVIDSPGDEPSVSEAIDRLRPMCGCLGSQGLVLAIENHDRFPARRLREMVLDLGPDVCKICLDTANSLSSLEGLETVLDELAEFAVCVHIKDVRAVRETHSMGLRISGKAAGQGQIDIPRVLDRVMKNGLDPSVLVETWPPQVVLGVPPLELESQMVDESIRYLFSLKKNDESTAGTRR